MTVESSVARVFFSAISEAQQETCNESWMVDFSLSTLICDADEPKPPPHSPITPTSGWVH